MKVCFFAPASELNESLRRCVEQAFGSPVMNLADGPIERWKEIVASADSIVVDVTAQNASACYLIGLGDALAKRVIILSPIRESVPVFAERHVIVHHWNLDLIQTELRKLSEPSANTNDSAIPNDDTPGKVSADVWGFVEDAWVRAPRGCGMGWIDVHGARTGDGFAPRAGDRQPRQIPERARPFALTEFSVHFSVAARRRLLIIRA